MIASVIKNPLFVKQLREEMRSRRVFFLVPIFIAILGTVAIVAIDGSTGTSFNPLTLAGNARITMFSFVITITILLGLICSVFGAASFTTEREKATYELLELTPLSYRDLVLGKFLHAFVISALILMSSLPIVATLFYMGGITYIDVALSFFYLLLFLAVVILGSICISIVSTRTILSIILSLGLGFALSVGLGIFSASAFREPSRLGFALLSPWLVTYQQIYAPVSLKLAGAEFPVWPFYLILYLLISSLLLCWARNALDARKVERNPWTRIVTLILTNFYVGIGLLCMRSYRILKANDAEDFFQVVMFLIVITLPFFSMGVLTDKDRMRFLRRPLLDSVHPGRLWLNYPTTGILFLFVLLFTVAMNFCFTGGVPWRAVSGYLSEIALWSVPWLLIFIAIRLMGGRPRLLFISYLLGTVLCTLISVFWHSRSPSAVSHTIFDFYLTTPNVLLLTIIGIAGYGIARVKTRRLLR